MKYLLTKKHLSLEIDDHRIASFRQKFFYPNEMLSFLFPIWSNLKIHALITFNLWMLLRVACDHVAHNGYCAECFCNVFGFEWFFHIWKVKLLMIIKTSEHESCFGICSVRLFIPALQLLFVVLYKTSGSSVEESNMKWIPYQSLK